MSERRTDLPPFGGGEVGVDSEEIERVWNEYSSGRIDGLEANMGFIKAGSGPEDPNSREVIIKMWGEREKGSQDLS